MNNVIVDFRCRITGEYYRVGSTYPVDDVDRVNYLIEKGFLEEATEVVSSSIPDDQQGGAAASEGVTKPDAPKRKASTKD